MGLHFREAPGRPKCWSRLEAVVGAFDGILLTDGLSGPYQVSENGPISCWYLKIRRFFSFIKAKVSDQIARDRKQWERGREDSFFLDQKIWPP